MTRWIAITLPICGAAVGIAFGVLGSRSDAPQKNSAHEAEMRQQVVRCWEIAREGCLGKCRTAHQVEIDAAMQEALANSRGSDGGFFTALERGHEMGTKMQACIDACAQVEVESRGEACRLR